MAFEFDRYVNGQLMAKGVFIERQNNLPDAMRAAARIASRGPNGEAPVLVLRAEALSRTDAVKAALSGDTSELIDRMAAAIREDGGHCDDAPWDSLSDERKEGWRGDACRALAVVKEYLTARLPEPAPRTVTEAMVEALKRIRDTAMEHTLAARIPECGVFGGIAQDADWLLSEITAVMEAAHDDA